MMGLSKLSSSKLEFVLVDFYWICKITILCKFKALWAWINIKAFWSSDEFSSWHFQNILDESKMDSDIKKGLVRAHFFNL